MDSLTHIILGAAIGEATLGRKIGNRALVWGAIGCTIPDLDVLASPFMDDITALAFHRSITHSLFFAVLAPFLFGALIFKLYHSKFHKSRFYKGLISAVNIIILLSVTYGINYLLRHQGYPRWWFLLITCLIALFLLFRLYRYYMVKDLEEPQVTFGQWYGLFALTFLFHILLDCCTTFGTQVFQPFSQYRVAFNNIAVADPFYTIPFLACILFVPFFQRNTRKRAIANWVAIGVSSLYMAITIYNKCYVDDVFDKALAHREINAIRCRTSPTILNNILWTCVAEDKDSYYVGQYSLFDTDPDLHYLNIIPKNDSINRLLSPYKDYQTLKWFSDGYLAAYPTDSTIVLSDLRYGGMSDTLTDQRDMVFNFLVREDHGTYTFHEYRQPFPGEFADVLKKFIHRIKGY